MAAQTIEIDVVINGKNQISPGIDTAKSKVDKFSESMKKMKNETDRLGNTHAKPTVSLVDRASSTLSKITNSARSFAGKTFRASIKVLDYATRPLRAIKNTLFSIKGLVAAVGTGLAANKLIAEPINLADSYSGAKIGFSTLLGDKEGQKMMDKLDEFAKRTPFKTSGVINNAQKMMSMGWDPKDVIKDMETIGDAAAATGKGDQGLESIIRALSQIKTKGKLSTEELNQLAEAGISAKSMLAEQLGYGTGDKGIAAMTKDLEKGLIGSEVAVKALLKGMEQFDGTMDRTANETVEGLKSQIEDAFEINVLRRWGQGLQDGAKRGFGSIVELLDKSEGSLEKMGDTVYEIGKELSNWAADKLEETIDKIMKITDRRDFKEASLGGKIKILWDEVIAEPFADWWESKGKPFMIDKMNGLGEGLGRGASSLIKGLLGITDSDAMGEATSIGGSFAKGFTKGFDGQGVVDAIGKAMKKGFKALFSGSWLSNLILAHLTVNLTSGILKTLSVGQKIWSGTNGGGAGGIAGTGLFANGLKGVLGSAGAGTGLLGFGANTAISLGAGNLAGGASLSAGALSAVGLGSVAGGVLGGAGLIKGGYNAYKAINADNSNDKKHYGWRAGTSIGMVGTGAAAGAAIGSVVPVLGTAAGALIGAGVGGVGALLAGNKVADSISGVKKSTKELKQEAKELKSEDMAKHFGKWELTATELENKVNKIIGKDTIKRTAKFNESLEQLASIESTLSTSKGTIDYTHERIMGKEKLSASDIDEYSASLKNYASSVKEYLNVDKTSTRSAFQLLYGDDTKGLQQMTKGINKTYTKMEKDLDKHTNKLNKVMSKAFKDGKITPIEEKEIAKILNQIEEIEQKIKEKTEKAENEASYDLIKKKYSNTDLTKESYKALMDELNKQNETGIQAADDAYIKAKAKIDLQLEDGSISKKKYEQKIKEIESKWLNAKSKPIKKSVEISFDIVKTNYSSQFEKLEKRLQSENLFPDIGINIKNSMIHKGKDGHTFEYGWNKNSKKYVKELQDSFLNSVGANEKIRTQMADLYESMKPQEKQLNELKKSYESVGEKVPQWINDSLSNIEHVKLMSGDMDTFYSMIGEEIAKTDKKYAESLKNTSGIPKALKEGIEKGLKETEVEVDPNVNTDKAAEKTKEKTEKALGKNQKVKKKADVDVKSDTKTDKAKSKTDSKTKKALGKTKNVSKKANVKVKEDTKTGSAKKKSEQKTKNALNKTTKVNKKANVNVKENTKTSGAKKSSESKIKNDLKGPVTAKTRTNVSANFGGFNGTLSALKKSVFSKIKSELANVNATTTVNIKARRFGGANSKQKEGNNAYGSRVDNPILTWVGENNNREYIIPVSAAKRQRGLDLWMQAGKDLGVMNNANGGAYGSNTSSGSSIGRLLTASSDTTSVNNTETSRNANRKQTVEVNVGGISIEIKGSGNGADADIVGNQDTICSSIAVALQEAFQNLPLATE